jgi:hypothetical protein
VRFIMNHEEMEDAVGQAQHALSSLTLFLRLATNNPAAIPLFDRDLFVSAYLELGIALSRLPKKVETNVTDIRPFLHRHAAE